MSCRRLVLSSLLVSIWAGPCAHAQSTAMPEATPESVGFSAERLKRLNASMQALVDSKQLAGIVTLVARHGKVVHQQILGQQDLASGRPMRKDSIFRIYSMTKPITGVAMMMLYEQGKWKPSDPDREAHSGVRQPEGLRGRGQWRNDAGGSSARAHGGRADVAHRGIHLRVLREHRGRHPVSAGEATGRRFARRVHRQGRHTPARLSTGRGVDVQRRGRYSGVSGGAVIGAAFP